MNDPHGNLTFFRVYSGKIQSGTMVLNSTRDKRERIGRILRMHANKREELTEADAGNIYAAVGLRDTRTGDTLCDEKHPIVLEKMVFPEPVISLAIEPKTKGDVEKLGVAPPEARLRGPFVPHPHRRGERADDHRRHGRAAPRDHRRPPEARVQGRVERRQARGRVPRGDREEGRPASTSTPSSRADAGSTATWSWRSSPPSAAPGFVFDNDIVGGVIPKEFIPAIEKGVREAMARGVLAGFPLVDMKCRLYDGSYHEVDSSAQAFEVAASLCFQDGAKPRGPDLLEPIMKIEVVVPEQYMGDVIGDLNSRRGRILGMSPARKRAGHRRRGAARRDVRLCDRPALDDPGARDLVAAVLPLRPRPAAVQEEIVAKVTGT